MWENSLEKLKVLNYETKFCAVKGKKCFNRVHFIVPGPNASNQFDDFVDVCAWLFLEISKSADMFKKEQFDDPTTVANKLMLGLRQLDFRSSFPSQKLKTPYGESVCSVLDFLTDKALAEKGFKWGAPVYNDSNEVCLLSLAAIESYDYFDCILKPLIHYFCIAIYVPHLSARWSKLW